MHVQPVADGSSWAGQSPHPARLRHAPDLGQARSGAGLVSLQYPHNTTNAMPVCYQYARSASPARDFFCRACAGARKLLFCRILHITDRRGQAPSRRHGRPLRRPSGLHGRSERLRCGVRLRSLTARSGSELAKTMSIAAPGSRAKAGHCGPDRACASAQIGDSSQRPLWLFGIVVVLITINARWPPTLPPA